MIFRYGKFLIPQMWNTSRQNSAVQSYEKYLPFTSIRNVVKFNPYYSRTYNKLDGLGFQPRWGGEFPVPAETRPKAHRASLIPGVKRRGRGVPHLLAPRLCKVQLHLYIPPYALMACCGVTFTFI